MENMSTPCAACKCLRRKCTKDCVFAPYFPANKQDKYEAVHKVFGASHVATILHELHPSQREDAMNSLAFEAQARLHDPVHGCTRMIYNLRGQIKDLKKHIQIARNELASYNIVPTLEPPPPITYQQHHHNPMSMPVLYNYGGQLTSQELQQLHEETRRLETNNSAQIQKTHADDAAQSERDNDGP